jgi:hypothetical protein
MGRLQAEAMVDAAIGLELQLEWHLVSNHYPPAPTCMVPVCIEALDAVNNYGDWDKVIPLPPGVTWKGVSVVYASVVIETFHLDSWLIERELY